MSLRNNPPTGSAQVTTPADRTAADRCHERPQPQPRFRPQPRTRGQDPPTASWCWPSVKWGYTNGLCYLVLDHNALNTLQTYAPITSNTPGGHFTAVVVGAIHWCGLRGDQTIVCDGLVDSPAIHPPAGPFYAIHAYGDHTCGSRADQTWVCWGDSEFGQSDLPDGRFADLSAGWFHACGHAPRPNHHLLVFRSRSHAIECRLRARPRPRRPIHHLVRWRIPRLRAAPRPNHHLLGIPTATGKPNLPSANSPPSLPARTTTCGLRPDQTITCWGDNRYGQAEPPTGQFTAVSVKSHGCGLRINGTVACWGHNASGEADPPNGQFIAVSVGGPYSCAIQADRTAVVCWGKVSLLRP